MSTSADPDPYAPTADVRLEHPAWSRSASIYQLNTRQFTAEGTFAAAAEHLDRIKALGPEIIWLMPVHDIGETNRKGTLGSPYAVKDYLSVNPDLGTVADLKAFVDAAHERGLHVILDWVANHSAWDNHLTVDHPDWYARDWKGDFMPTPWWDWVDIIDFDYSVPALRRYMAEAMAYWVREVGIDGYRCDVAGFVPTDFWETVRRELDAIKPVFLLAEWEARDLHTAAFDMTYAWSWNETMHEIAVGTADAEAMRVFYALDAKAYQRDSIRMMFVSNHDKNAWEGTEYEQFGEAVNTAIVLSVVSKGMPLVYNGQEAGNDRRLEFFEKDAITWREHPMREFYTRLLTLKRDTPALWNGRFGAPMINVPTSDPAHVISFVRAHPGDADVAASRIFAIFNLSPDVRTVELHEGLFPGDYTDVFTGDLVRFEVEAAIELEPWDYRVYRA